MTLTDLTFRPVRIDDKSRVLDFTRNTWGEDDDDYIQYVFDDWLVDPRGEFTAAVVDGEVAGIAKLTDMGDGEWWLEGLRIDPAFRRQGVAREFNRYHVELAKRLGGKVIRYMTGGQNVGSQAIGARAGFQHIITYRAYVADASGEFTQPLLLTTDDFLALTHWIDSPLMLQMQGVYRAAWTVKTLTEAEIRRALEAQIVYGLKDATGHLTAWAVLRPDEFDEDSEDGEPHRLRVDHLDGEMSAVTELARRIRALAATRQRSVVSAGVGDYPPLIEALQSAGYQLNQEHPGLWVLELKLTSNGPHSDAMQ
jgi:ribosomal protein S18 acetylase RimI-like enzyme